LTQREVEVLRLAASGKSKQQIAQSLGVAPKTADNHLQHAYSKIGVSTRASAALFVMEHGLLPPRSSLG
jgi:DNA-binding CsgD family transcriptional regulator